MTLDDGSSGAAPPPDPAAHADVPSGPEDVLPARPPGRRAKPEPEPTPSPLGRLILPVILLLVAAVAVFAAWNQLGSDRSDVAGGPTPTTSASPSASPTTSKPVKPSASASASAKPTATPSPTPSSSSPSPSASAVVIDRSVPVTVLNGTRRTGLAASVAADLRAKGWTVVSIGNWRGSGVETTTVFIDGREDAAATMRRDLKAADATEEPIGAMRDNRLTVVLMDDYPRS